jgi:hypothetical protein
LIDFEFRRFLKLREQVRAICGERGWEFQEVEGDLGLLQRLVNGDWRDNEVLVVTPGKTVAPSFDASIVREQT